MTTLDSRPDLRVDPLEDPLEHVLRHGLLRAALQPVHDVVTGRPVAVEALLRGPAGAALTSPAHLFRAAAAAGRTGELDRAAADTALAAVAGAARTLFLNTSLEGFTSRPDLPEGLEVVVDVSARTLLDAPGAGARLLRRVRDLGLRVALDDLGAEPGASALLPLVRPEIVKLDLRLLARRPAEEVAALTGAVGAYAARTGALVLAESVEDAEDHRTALALGADLVQGWGVAHPARPEDLPAPPGPLPLPAPAPGAPTALAWRAAPTRAVPAEVAEAALTHLRLRVRRRQGPVALVSLGGQSARRAAADLGRVAVRGHLDLDGHGLAVLGPDTACVVLARPGRAPGERELLLAHDPDLVADLVTDVLATERTPAPQVAAPSPQRSTLTDVVGQALEADRATGTGTGLLLVGVDGICRAGGREAVVRRMRRAVRSVDRWIPLGPDLFAVLLTGLPRAGSEGVVERVADALLLAVELAVNDHPAVSVSIGASLAPARAVTAAEAHRQAAAALESARGAGGHCARIWPV
ncbi:EAL domain-containing protein [Kineococcus sp. TBRC 1896]|uniref:EAL domain-containing protein n=1 Tax=Kineococcus mangrovi TaxID=1660183 RepID=A0ABV4I178_9ACTN